MQIFTKNSICLFFLLVSISQQKTIEIVPANFVYSVTNDQLKVDQYIKFKDRMNKVPHNQQNEQYYINLNHSLNAIKQTVTHLARNNLSNPQYYQMRVLKVDGFLILTLEYVFETEGYVFFVPQVKIGRNVPPQDNRDYLMRFVGPGCPLTLFSSRLDVDEYPKLENVPGLLIKTKPSIEQFLNSIKNDDNLISEMELTMTFTSGIWGYISPANGASELLQRQMDFLDYLIEPVRYKTKFESTSTDQKFLAKQINADLKVYVTQIFNQEPSETSLKQKLELAIDNATSFLANESKGGFLSNIMDSLTESFKEYIYPMLTLRLNLFSALGKFLRDVNKAYPIGLTPEKIIVDMNIPESLKIINLEEVPRENAINFLAFTLKNLIFKLMLNFEQLKFQENDYYVPDSQYQPHQVVISDIIYEIQSMSGQFHHIDCVSGLDTLDMLNNSVIDIPFMLKLYTNRLNKYLLEYSTNVYDQFFVEATSVDRFFKQLSKLLTFNLPTVTEFAGDVLPIYHETFKNDDEGIFNDNLKSKVGDFDCKVGFLQMSNSRLLIV